MTTVDPITAKYGTSYSTSASTSSNEMSGADFMKLLLAQLTHQNPLEPMSDADMMNQYAQLNSVQELQNMTSLMTQNTVISQTAYAASLIGREVEVATGTDTSVTGVVTGVSVENGSLMLHIGDETYALSDVMEIHQVSESE
jgi:flagellar basal-body rod modification protein FlgD